jgi:hypothetical protein
MEAHVVAYIGAIIHCCQVLDSRNWKKNKASDKEIEGESKKCASQTLTLEIWGTYP